MKMERSGISLYANKITKLAITSLTAIMFVGCNGGGINLSKLGNEFHNLVESLPEPPSKNSGKICSTTKLGCNMAYTIQKLPKEERLSCEWNYCHNIGNVIEGVTLASLEQVCKPSEERFE